DLTFKVPKQYVLVGVGKQVKEGKEGDFAVSQWVSDIPLAVAGFNYGKYKKQAVTDEQAKYQIEGYATSDLPDWLRGAENIGGMTPTALTGKAVGESRNSVWPNRDHSTAGAILRAIVADAGLSADHLVLRFDTAMADVRIE